MYFEALESDPGPKSIFQFSFLVKEGKAKSTGKTLFEAENQAARGGAYLLNLHCQLMHELDDKFWVPGEDENRTPLAFSICSKGFTVQLWAHYHESVEGVDQYIMHLIEGFYVQRVNGMVAFLTLVDQLITWYKDVVLTKIANLFSKMISEEPEESEESEGSGESE